MRKFEYEEFIEDMAGCNLEIASLKHVSKGYYDSDPQAIYGQLERIQESINDLKYAIAFGVLEDDREGNEDDHKNQECSHHLHNCRMLLYICCGLPRTDGNNKHHKCAVHA